MKIKSTVAALSAAVAVAGTLALVSTSAQAADCKHKVGSILSLTGSYGAYGVPISRLPKWVWNKSTPPAPLWVLVVI